MNENEAVTPPNPPPSDTPSPSGMSIADERTWALLAHLSTFTAFVTGIGILAGPLLVWLFKREGSAFVDDQGKEALNFNITVVLVSLALCVFALITFGIGLIVAVPVGFMLFLWWFVLTIIAAISANNGTRYRYPLTLRLVT